MIDLLILFAVAMAVSAVGWKYFVYFFSLGYGIAALAGTMGVMYHANMSVPTIAMLVLLFIFGIRLGTYLLVRERKTVGYHKILYGEVHSDKKPAGVMIIDHTRL
jgi:steroid 5-alpha reductase family enzyme